MSNLKLHKIEQVKLWINILTSDKFGMDSLKLYNGDELEKMSIKEIDMLLKFISVSFHCGYNQALENHRKTS